MPTTIPATAITQILADYVVKAKPEVIEQHVPHAIGSIARPMTERDLELKCHGLTDGILGMERSKELLALCWNLESLEEVAVIAHAGRL
jgi:hypothetical protein